MSAISTVQAIRFNQVQASAKDESQAKVTKHTAKRSKALEIDQSHEAQTEIIKEQHASVLNQAFGLIGKIALGVAGTLLTGPGASLFTVVAYGAAGASTAAAATNLIDKQHAKDIAHLQGDLGHGELRVADLDESLEETSAMLEKNAANVEELERMTSQVKAMRRARVLT